MTTPGHDGMRGHGAPARTASRWWRVSIAVITLSVSVCCLATLWLLMSDATFPFLVLAGWALVLLGALWLVIGLFGVVRYRGSGKSNSRRGYWPLLLAPCAVVLTYALAWANLPQDLGWRVSTSSLERVATSCQPADRGRHGVYTITSVVKRGDGCVLYSNGGFINPVGFAYFPHGAPRDNRDVSYTSLQGSWYRFEEQF